MLALFAIASAISIIAKRSGFPYTVGLVLGGLALSATQLVHPPRLTQELLYVVFLPGLLFEAAFHLKVKSFWQNKGIIVGLAVPGVMVAMLLTAGLFTPLVNALEIVERISFGHGLLFASIIAATDPLAVVSIFKSLGAPKRLGVLVEGESLLNDGTSVVVFGIVLASIVEGHFEPREAAWDFVNVVGLGLLIGGAAGLTVGALLKRVRDPMVEITLTVIAAYAPFAIAESIHVSGVIATVVAGMLCGHAAPSGMSPTSQIAAGTFWEYFSFVLNSIVFLLIGASLDPHELLGYWQPILVAWAAVTLGRAAVVAVISGIAKRTKERIPSSWAAVLTWGGLRGGLSMVLVLTLPEDLPHRTLLLNVVFGVVFVSIIVQGTTMEWLLKRLRIVGTVNRRHEYEMRRGELIAAKVGFAELDQIEKEGFASDAVIQRVRASAAERVESAELAFEELGMNDRDLQEEERQAVERRLLFVQKHELLEARRAGLLSEEAFAELAETIDQKMHIIDHEDEKPRPAPQTPTKTEEEE